MHDHRTSHAGAGSGCSRNFRKLDLDRERSPSLWLYDSHRRDGIAAFHSLVPARDGVDRKLGGVVINAHAHAAGVGGDFVDAVAPIEAALGPRMRLDGRTIGPLGADPAGGPIALAG
jgi:hypothetical protein